ncbi:hypothetical protein H4582DRAFT_2131786 [Lactarius indigo]|nr:hypothetical protein H4582DRAFT_2131786 [Lactarius indigo]
MSAISLTQPPHVRHRRQDWQEKFHGLSTSDTTGPLRPIVATCLLVVICPNAFPASPTPENIMVSENVFHQRGITLLYRTFNLMIQSVLYGIYASLVPVSTYIMMKKGLRLLSQKILFGVILFMFSLSTAYLAVSIADLITLIKTWYLSMGLSESTGTNSPTEALLILFNALTPINYALTDGVVVWRAWIICRDEYRKLLRVPIVMLVLTMLTVAATIGIRVFINTDPIRDKNRLATIINVFQEITLISSLLTNILGTSVISLKAWRYRRWIVTDLQRVVNLRTKTERVLALLVESGVFYIFSGVRMVTSLLKKGANSSLIQSMLVASSFIRLPGSHIMLGNVYSQAAVHMAGMYPVIVVVLVSREASMDKTVFNQTLPVVITDLQQASSHFAANQTASRQAKSTHMTSLQFASAQAWSLMLAQRSNQTIGVAWSRPVQVSSPEGIQMVAVSTNLAIRINAGLLYLPEISPTVGHAPLPSQDRGSFFVLSGTEAYKTLSKVRAVAGGAMKNGAFKGYVTDASGGIQDGNLHAGWIRNLSQLT